MSSPPLTTSDEKTGSQSISLLIASTETVIFTPLWMKSPVMLWLMVMPVALTLSLSLAISVVSTVAV